MRRRKLFTSQNKPAGSSIVKIIVPIALFLVIAVVVIVGTQSVSASTQEERLRTMEQAVRRSVVQCYAIEGRYPQSLEYLQEQYGLSLDNEKYIYHYQTYGANILPQIKVFSNE